MACYNQNQSIVLYFIECRVGYIGANCLETCSYNSYGKGCQMTCNCMKDDCDFALGCKADNPGTWFFFYQGFQ